MNLKNFLKLTDSFFFETVFIQVVENYRKLNYLFFKDRLKQVFQTDLYLLQ